MRFFDVNFGKIFYHFFHHKKVQVRRGSRRPFGSSSDLYKVYHILPDPSSTFFIFDEKDLAGLWPAGSPSA
jgi:hypothetical protein